LLESLTSADTGDRPVLRRCYRHRSLPVPEHTSDAFGTPPRWWMRGRPSKPLAHYHNCRQRRCPGGARMSRLGHNDGRSLLGHRRRLRRDRRFPRRDLPDAVRALAGVDAVLMRERGGRVNLRAKSVRRSGGSAVREAPSSRRGLLPGARGSLVLRLLPVGREDT
jgi:hypothetical protein